MALAVTVVERLPAMAAGEPTRLSHDDELVLIFGEVPVRRVSPGRETTEERDAERQDASIAQEQEAWYVIQPGDTLSSIAEDLLGSAGLAADLARLNGLSDPDQLTPGEALRLR